MKTTSSLFSQRLVAARKMAGLSLQDLSVKLDNYVSRQALQRYETDVMLPGSDVLIRLADALGVTPDYFFKEQNIVLDAEIDYRRTTKLLKSDNEAILEKIKHQLGLVFELEDELNIENKKTYFIYEPVIRSAEDAEKAAVVFREAWELGYDPIPDVVKMLEDKGYYVVEIDAPQSFDGLKATVNGKRIISLRKLEVGEDVVRRRFTSLHELAHHSLKFDDSLSHKESEKLCHTFACAVLYPKEMAEKELSKNRFHFYQNELELIKRRWGISFPAIFSRAVRLGIITEAVYKRLTIGYRARRLHLNEPGIYPADERPNRFVLLLYQALANEAITLNEAAYYMGKSVGEFREELQTLL